MLKWRPWWFDLLFVAVLAVTLPSIISSPPPLRTILLVVQILFFVGYLLARPRSVGVIRPGPTAKDYAGTVLIIACLVTGSYHSTEFSQWLALACPVVWVAVHVYWQGFGWNVAMILLTGGGLFLGDARRGTLASGWPLDLAITGLTMVFSLMMGTMVHSTVKWNKEREELLEELQASGRDLAESYQQLMAKSEAPHAAGGDSPLSAREIEVLALASQGCTNNQIGTRLHISPATVKTHMEHILTKLGATTRTQAVLIAHQEGLFPHDPV